MGIPTLWRIAPMTITHEKIATMYTTKQAAAAAGLTVRTIQAHIKRGNLKAVKIGRDWFIEPGDLDTLTRQPGKPKGKRQPGASWHE